MNTVDQTESKSLSTLHVIGAGFGRTGTTSLMKALEILGYSCFHGSHLYQYRNQSITARWVKILSNKRPIELDKEWDEIYGRHGFTATTDFPSCLYYEELLQHYPKAKVILTVRDSDRWYQSVKTTLYRQRNLSRYGFFKYIPFCKLIYKFERALWGGFFDGKFGDDPDFAKQKLIQHIKEVKSRVPADRLLVYSVKEGWLPLCNFLNTEVPGAGKVPFPNLNESIRFNRICTLTKIVHNLTVGLFIIGLGVVIWSMLS